MTSAQAQLIAILKTKGTGPTMSKSLTKEDFPLIEKLFRSPEAHLTTKATLLTALLTLPPTDIEALWIQKLAKQPQRYLPAELCPLFSQVPPEPGFKHKPMLNFVRQVISHRSLNLEDCSQAMGYLTNRSCPDYLKAAFLEGERLKRETIEENKAFLDFLWQNSSHTRAKVPFLIDLSNGYDGFNRTLYLTPFTAVTLAAAGFPTVMHGMDEISPKNGVNPYKLLKLAEKNPLKKVSEVVKDIENPEISWGYVDQSEFSPTLYALKPLRMAMIKRPFLATLEKLLQPVSAEETYLVTSYTHPPYKHTLTALLSDSSSWKKALILRGAEGSIQLSLDRRTPWTCSSNSDFVKPEEYDLQETDYPGSTSLEDSLLEGISALGGNLGYARDAILYQGSVILEKLSLCSRSESILLLKNAIDSEKALATWNKGMQ